MKRPNIITTDNRTKYRVKTKALKEFEYGEVLTDLDNDGWYYSSDGFTGLKIDVIKRNPQWFEIIADEWEVKWGGMRINADINQSVKMGMAYWYVTDGDTEIKFAGMSEHQSKAICNALNEL